MENIQQLIQHIEQVIKGKTHQIELVLSCLFARGHILMEDNPGTGKTVLARTLAGSIYDNNKPALFKRIQFTPDLLPMDLIGSHIYDELNKEFIFKKGPLFCNVLLADEINRASPKVQSALLECMAENQISIGEKTYKLEDLFFTIATQNPIETEGTYPLPTAQLDRFFMKINLGYVDEQEELNIYKNYLDINTALNTITPIMPLQEVVAIQQQCDAVFIHEEIIRGVNNIVRATRNHPDISLGASTRSGIAFIKCLKAYALIKGREYVSEQDIATLCHAILDHRLLYRNKEGRLNALQSILNGEVTRLTQLRLTQ